MKEFSTRPGSFQEIRRKIVPTLLSIYGGLFVIIIVLPRIASDEPINWNILVITTLIFVVVITLATRSTLARYRKGFESYRLTIDNRSLRREQENLPVIEIQIDSVTRIVKHANGSIVVTGTSKLNAISIPAQIERLAELTELLDRIHSVEVRTKKPLIERLFVPVSLLGGLLVVVNAFATNRIVDLTCSILLVIVMLGGFTVIQFSKNVDYSTRRMSWIFLIPVAAYLVNIILLLRMM